jgi:hypothetical protein
MSNESNFSLNLRSLGLTVRGDTYVEFKLRIAEVADDLSSFLDLVAHVEGGGNAVPAMNTQAQPVQAANAFPSKAGAPWDQPAQQQYTPPAAQQYAPPQQTGPLGETCRHGQMTFRSGTSKASGKPYSGYFCPNGDRNDQCPPKFSGR